MADFLIQKIDLDRDLVQAIDYGRGLQKHLIEKAISVQAVASIAGTTAEGIQFLIAGTSNQASQISLRLWHEGDIYPEAMILNGQDFPNGSWRGKVIAI